MTVHLLKLAAGIASFADLQKRLTERAITDTTLGTLVPVFTRNTPKQKAKLLDGGSLYWVAGGQMVGRTAFLDIKEDVDDAGRKYCLLCVSSELKRVRAAPKRAFQGWRYLDDHDTPEDIDENIMSGDIPEDMLNELQKLGLL
ncbi:MAG: DUF1489 family protein [Kordiimonas sp.]